MVPVLWKAGTVTSEEIVLLVICGVLAIGAALTGFLVHRQSGHKPHLFAGIGWALAAIGLYLSGLAMLVWQAIQGIIAWAVGLASSIPAVIGVALLAVGVLVAIFSRVSTQRTKAKVASRRPPAAVTPTAPASAAASYSSATSSDEPPSLARRLGRMTRNLRDKGTSTSSSASSSAQRPAPQAPPAAAAPSRRGPSGPEQASSGDVGAASVRPSKPLLDMGDSWNTLDLDTPAAPPSPTAAGAPLPSSPATGQPAPTQRPRGASADDQVQQIQSALRPPGEQR